LLAEKNLELFALMSNGDLGKGIRKLRNVPEPEPKQVLPAEDEEKNGNEVEIDSNAEAKMEEDYDLYDFLKEGNPAPAISSSNKLSSTEPEDGEVEDI
jgi:hypothetical protein